MKYFVIAAGLFFAGLSSAYAGGGNVFRSIDRDTQTLFNQDVSHGGYGALVFGMAVINDQPVYLRGTRGAWIINMSPEHALNIGLGNYRTETNVEPVEWNEPVAEPEMRVDYGGFELEYVNRTYRLMHFSAQALIASGEVRYADQDIELDKTRDRYLAIQPGVNVNLNITNWFRISGGLIYHWASSVNLAGTDNRDLSGPGGYIGLRFGKF